MSESKVFVPSPSVGVRTERDVAKAQGLICCEYCKCVFVSAEDYALHLVRFGIGGTHAHKVQLVHRESFLNDSSFKYGVLGYCLIDKKHPIRLPKTIDNVVLCVGCRHFKGVVE